MKLPLATLGRHVGGIILAAIVWWAVTILIGLALFQIWPPELIPVSGDEGGRSFSIMLGVSLGRNWQNIPANVLGFVSALYAFRALCPKYKATKETGG
jgi:urea transporter